MTKSNKLVISSTTIIASIILIVIIFIILYNSYIYPILHQDKLQFTQELFNTYISNIKHNFNISDFIINIDNIIINIKLSDNNDDTMNLSIIVLKKNNELYKIDKIIDKKKIIYNDTKEKLQLDINYDDIMNINYNYIYNRFILNIKDDIFSYEGRFKIKCSNSPFICNTSKYNIFRNFLIDNKYTYDNIFGDNEYSKIKLNNKIKTMKNGYLLNFINKTFLNDYLLLNISDRDWILYFIINKLNNKYTCYMLIKNKLSEKTLYCGFLNSKLKFFHNINIELNIGSNINQLKFKFFSENLLINFNSNNIKNTNIDYNKLITSIDLSINYNNELINTINDIYIYSNKDLSEYNNLLLTI